MVEGHRRTDMPWSLNAPASGRKTGAASHSFERTGESRPGLGLRQSARPQPAHYNRTSRNVTDGKKFRLSGIDQVGAGRVPVRNWFRLIETNNAMDASDLNSRRLLFHASLPGTAALLNRRSSSAKSLGACPRRV